MKLNDLIIVEIFLNIHKNLENIQKDLKILTIRIKMSVKNIKI